MIIVVLTSGGCSSDIFMILKLILFSDAKLCWIKMGKLLSKIFGSKEMRILMLGLDAAGKTSILSLVMKTNHNCTCWLVVYVLPWVLYNGVVRKIKVFLTECEISSMYMYLYSKCSIDFIRLSSLCVILHQKG